MKKILLSSALFFSLLFSTNAQTFIKSYDVHYGSSGAVTATKDGGFIRSATFLYDRHTHIMITKTNAAGNVQWSKRWGPVTSSTVSNVVQTLDGGYALSGAGNDGARNGMMLLKLSGAGNMQWVKYYTTNLESYSTVLRQTPDGGYIFAGCQVQAVIDYEKRRACIMRTDSAGNLLWGKPIFNFSRYLSSIEDIAITGEGFMLAGGYGITKTNIGCYLIKLKNNGTLDWAKVMPESNANKLNFVKTLKNGGYLTGGYIAGNNNRGDMFITKVNASGVSLWSKIIANTQNKTDEFNDAIEIPGGYLVVGYTDSSEFPSSSYWPALARFSETGKLLNAVILPAPEKTYASSISAYTPNGFAVALTEYLNAEKIYMAKFNKTGNFCGTFKKFGVTKDTAVAFTNTTVSISNFNNLQISSLTGETVELPLTVANICNSTIAAGNASSEQLVAVSNVEDAAITVSPNPVVNTLQLKWINGSNEPASVEIYAVTGKKVYEKILTINKGSNNTSIPVADIAKGVYLLKLKTGTTTKTVKFVKE